MCESGEALVGNLVTISGIQARPELNGLLGFAKSLNVSTGRLAVRLPLEVVALKPTSLQLADCHVPSPTTISEMGPVALLELIREEWFGMHDAVAEAAYRRALKLMGGGRAEDTVLIDGGVFKLVIASLNPLQSVQAVVMGFATVALGVLGGDDDAKYRNAKYQGDYRKALCVDAGGFEAVLRVLRQQKTSDVQAAGLSVVANLTAGSITTGGDRRRDAAVRAGVVPVVAAAMRLYPHRSAVIHFAAQALGSISADPITASVVKKQCVEEGVIKLLVEGLIRHKDAGNTHRMPFGDWTENGGVIEVDGTVLEGGCLVLNNLVCGDHDGDVEGPLLRARAAFEAGVMGVVGAAARDPQATKPLFFLCQSLAAPAGPEEFMKHLRLAPQEDQMSVGAFMERTKGGLQEGDTASSTTHAWSRR